MKFTSGLPFTETERNYCLGQKHDVERRTSAKAHKRRKLAPSQDYQQQPTEAQKRRDARIMGEKLD